MDPAAVLLVVCAISAAALAKIYKRCELARELLHRHEVPRDQVATWVCIALHESNLDTAAFNSGSKDYGIFQISGEYWCSPGGAACGLPCSSLRDEDISDDMACAKRIYNQHKRVWGDGFMAWAVYPHRCKRDAGRYVEGCFAGTSEVAAARTTTTTTTTERAKERAKAKAVAKAVVKDGYAFDWKGNGFRLLKVGGS